MGITIYSLQNKENWKIYIGSSGSLEERIAAHFSMLKSGSHHCSLMQKDYNDGLTNFDVFIIEEDVSLISRTERELHWMLKLKTYEEAVGYNGNDPLLRGLLSKKKDINFIKAVPVPNTELLED